MSIYILNKIRIDPEIFDSKVDPSVTKKDLRFPQSFDFEGMYQKIGR
jgi:hypothetical protein